MKLLTDFSANPKVLVRQVSTLFFTFALALVAANGEPAQVVSAVADASLTERTTLRDRFWIWTHVAGSYKGVFGLPDSRMTPVEGAVYLGVPNVLFIRFHEKPEIPFDQHAIAFRPFKRVVWSLVGASGQTSDEERKHVLDLPNRFPNITGFVMDDFFREKGPTGSLSVEQLKNLRSQLVIGGKKRDLYVVLYQHQLEFPVTKHLDLCDKITFWTWKAEDLGKLESSFERLEKLAPNQGKLLGCYLWDFGTRKTMPLNLMKKQCELGRRWLKEARIEGMIFLGSNVCDLELETVEWTRKWIAEVGSEPLH
ncbi:MAG: hypothetical protein MUF81_00655 [Verrucomicrobia bacterium]|jgi:hypothetical protein|nr:hypothetical protein [Verrucomicrobiota bacterium]